MTDIMSTNYEYKICTGSLNWMETSMYVTYIRWMDFHLILQTYWHWTDYESSRIQNDTEDLCGSRFCKQSS